MVERIGTITLLCIIASVMCRLIGKYNKEQAFMLSAAVCAIILSFAAVRLTPVFEFINTLCNSCGVNEKYMMILFKTAGICYITQFACDICRDCGESAISTAAEISGRAALLIVSLPLLEDIVSVVQKYTS